MQQLGLHVNQLILIKGKDMGVAKHKPIYDGTMKLIPVSIGAYCPACGEVWLQTNLLERDEQQYNYTRKLCKPCGDGSILDFVLHDEAKQLGGKPFRRANYIPHLTPQLLAYELGLAVDNPEEYKLRFWI